MKKLISLLVCFALLISSVSAFAAAESADDTPVIFVPGFMQPYMFIESEVEGEEDFYLWLPHIESIFKRIIDDMPNFIRSIFGLIGGDVRGFGETLGGGAYAVAQKLSCNPDGSSVYPITHYKNDPAEANGANLKKIVNINAERKNFLFEDFADYLIENNYTDYENIFIFEYDSRWDAIQISEELRTYIKAVKDYTKSEKVNLFTVSYGGLITATYLYSYMQEGDVAKAVLNVPPLQGTDFTDKLFRETVNLPLYTLIDFVESVLCLETNIAPLLKNTDSSFFNTLLTGASGGMLGVVEYWSSIYTITSNDYYEDLKKDFLDPVESKPLIERNDKIHYEIMPSMKETFEKCKAYGTDVSIITCTGSSICFGGELDGDILVPTYSASGATTAPLGKSFENGYTPLGTSCDNTEHNHVSPAMNIDASTAYLPEKTWFVEGSYHAMFELEEYTRALSAKLLFTDELKDVHSDPEYPQFQSSNNPHRGLRAKFNSSLPGYVNSKDSKLIIENIYANSPVIITAVTAQGMDISFDLSKAKFLMPGEAFEIAFSGEIPTVNATRADIKIRYLKIGGGIKEINIPVTISNQA